MRRWWGALPPLLRLSNMNSQFKFRAFEEELLSPLRGHALTELKEFVASLLLEADSSRPIKIAEIIIAAGNRFADWPTERDVKETVRSLRKDHGFPILSRKGKPAGYWWGTSVSEMEKFIEDWRKQALDELHTLSKIVKQNYPQLAGQLSLEAVNGSWEGESE